MKTVSNVKCAKTNWTGRVSPSLVNFTANKTFTACLDPDVQRVTLCSLSMIQSGTWASVSFIFSVSTVANVICTWTRA